jgi:eukaryotic-like serine/threonine-protein kinase
MDLSAGTRLGPYEILAPIGAGGMGEVYRARDTKLGRDIALKVLPEAFASDPGRMARFQREAELLASLNHPNIAHIYSVEERALVMELVEGETLSSPLPIDTALNYARQIAEALDYAHEKGVIHRDLKPANIKVTPEDMVKLLDFGLAKAVEDLAPDVAQVGGGPADDPSHSPTLTLGVTRVGVIMGTAAYMSPEQAGGKHADRRADIWSFGAVLYEMLAGKKAFEGESVSDTLASVLKVDPDWDALPAATPASIRRLVRRCLTKDRRQRLQAIGEARIILNSPTAEESAPVTAPQSWLGMGASIAAGVFLIALGILSFIHFRQTPPPKILQRYIIAAPENASLLQGFAISPDGRSIAISAIVNGRQQLWLRALDALQAQPMPGTDDAIYPFWSPDSRYIGFFDQRQAKLKKIAVSSGLAQSLCDAPGTLGGSWNRDNVIVFAPGGRIERVSAAGGVPADVTRAKGFAVFPAFLPDGRHFLYYVTGVSAEQDGVYLGSLDGKESRRVLADESSVIFAAGRLLFIRENTLMAQPFNTSSGQIVGEVSPVAEGVSLTANGSYAPVTASETGMLLYESGGNVAGGNSQMGWYDRSGKLLGAIGAPGRVFDPAISPDEKSVVFRRQVSAGVADLWLWDLTRGAEQRFTTDTSSNIAPFWAPKGDRIMFASTRRDGIFNLYQKAAGGTAREELLLRTGHYKLPSQWSRDGRFIVYSENDPKTKNDIWVLPMDGGADRKPAPFLHSEFNEILGQLSPDGRWMAYTSDKTGHREVYVVSFPAGEGETRISIAGGEQPRWRGDGKEMFFVAADAKMMSVAVKAGLSSGAGNKASFEPAAPQPLFEAHLPGPGRMLMFEYDVTTDAKRFLLDSEVPGSASAPPLNVIVNWDAVAKK